jgi:hypothetical protein
MTNITKLSPSETPSLSLLSEMYVEKGTKEDWENLHHLHYKSTEGGDGSSFFWRCMHGDDLVGVVCFKTPDILCRERHLVFPQLKPTGKETKAGNKARMDLHINKNFLRINRTVTSTMYRGCGAAYRMINLACRMQGLRYIEIISAMSKFNKFVERAGFLVIPPSPSIYEKETKTILSSYFTYSKMTDFIGFVEEYEQFNEKYKATVLHGLQNYYFSISAREKTGGNKNKTVEDNVRKMSFESIIKQIIQISFTQKVYGVYKNPDYGIHMPERLPLTAFDNQKANEKLFLMT